MDYWKLEKLINKMPKTKKTTKEVKTVKKVIGDLLVKIYNLSGKEKGTVSLPKEIFKVKVNPKLLAQYIRVYLANQRQGTASTKTRGEVTGSTRKIYRQKGTGRARHGDIKAPIFVGGGVVGGPRPKDYSLKLNKKQKRKALFCALTLKQKENNIIGLTDSSLNIKPKTKTVVNFLETLSLGSSKNLLILPKMEKNNLLLAARNIVGIKLIDARSLNAYDISSADKLIFMEEALKVLAGTFCKK